MLRESRRLGVSLVLPDEITQGQMEAYFIALRKQNKQYGKVSDPEFEGAVARAAAEIGWLQGGVVVEQMRPAAVRWVARQINQYIGEAVDVPEE